MSVTRTHSGRKRYGRHAGPPAPRYAAFKVEPGHEHRQALIQAHLDWLLRNMDYFALRGRATVHSAGLALHRDLDQLGQIVPQNQHEQQERENAALAQQIEALKLRLRTYNGRFHVLASLAGKSVKERESDPGASQRWLSALIDSAINWSEEARSEGHK